MESFPMQFARLPLITTLTWVKIYRTSVKQVINLQQLLYIFNGFCKGGFLCPSKKKKSEEMGCLGNSHDSCTV